MFFSGNAIILQTNLSKYGKDLRNNSFEINGEFYSITLFHDSLDTGIINWSKSFTLGAMVTINFMKVNDFIILFTSSTQNYIYMKEILIKIINPEIEVSLYKLPFPLPNTLDLKTIKGIANYEIDPFFGLDFILNIANVKSILKIFTNGLITYSMTNDENVLKTILNITFEIIGEVNEQYEL
ncbi:hypothetical protein COL99_08455 [Bacillus toyonensis]|uniref:hypothetical protein n=1 Tax=Bacillus cereus group TaxID=86661 RepID=UPI000B415F39|nr:MULTISPECIES: hypothetical protein [Bacillus cereus group]MEB9697767.1 hypothetical protein [Bacillus cereus]ARX66040.1 hypothetical protein BVH75_08280 [Bacillus thuringiensis]PEF14026.1 hypothetical protein CON23_03045 [Bacillus thuringiensis]PGC14123.1 hypothetical protein COL99_08455 [Bacillus toyonensis]PGC72707.1 hypothetical protein COM28_27045 [Bacillus toyonensis]